MPNLYAPMNGVNTKQKSIWGLMGGVNTKMKNGWGLLSGVNKKIFSSAIEWTYTVSLIGGGTVYGVDATYSCQLRTTTNEGDDDATDECDVRYTFKKPLSLNAGSTITLITTSQYGINNIKLTRWFLQLNDSEVWEHDNQSGTYTYTVTTATTLTTLTATVLIKRGHNQLNYATLKVIVNPLNGDSFLLNNTGISN